MFTILFIILLVVYFESFCDLDYIKKCAVLEITMDMLVLLFYPHGLCSLTIKDLVICTVTVKGGEFS